MYARLRANAHATLENKRVNKNSNDYAHVSCLLCCCTHFCNFLFFGPGLPFCFAATSVAEWFRFRPGFGPGTPFRLVALASSTEKAVDAFASAAASPFDAASAPALAVASSRGSSAGASFGADDDLDDAGLERDAGVDLGSGCSVTNCDSAAVDRRSFTTFDFDALEDKGVDEEDLPTMVAGKIALPARRFQASSEIQLNPLTVTVAVSLTLIKPTEELVS